MSKRNGPLEADGSVLLRLPLGRRSLVTVGAVLDNRCLSAKLSIERLGLSGSRRPRSKSRARPTDRSSKLIATEHFGDKPKKRFCDSSDYPGRRAVPLRSGATQWKAMHSVQASRRHAFRLPPEPAWAVDKPGEHPVDHRYSERRISDMHELLRNKAPAGDIDIALFFLFQIYYSAVGQVRLTRS
jgi:hypothetical protein